MFDKILNIIKNKDILVPNLLFYNYKKLNITDQELILLIYIINSNSSIYNPKDISDKLNIELVDVLTLINGLTEKGILSLEMKDTGNKKVEILNINQLYEKLTFLIVNKEEEKDNSIFTVFETELARTLSPIEYDIINSWKDGGFSDEIISQALKEAIYNGVTSLKYIDKILEEWRKKGIKNKNDVEKSRKQFKEQKSKKITSDIFTYDWLNDEE